MTFKSAVSTIRCDIKHFGIKHALYDVLLRSTNRLILFRVLRLVTISKVKRHDPLPAGYLFKPIMPDDLAKLAQDKAYEINPVLLRESRQAGNSCFGIFDGSRLANYLFIYTTPALMTDDLQITFGRNYAYLCATFTHPDYRGRHMNSIAAAFASGAYLDKGFKKLLAYVDANNFSSLKSLFRVGWVAVDTIYIVRIFGRYFIRSGAGSSAHEFRITQLPANGDAALLNCSDRIRDRAS